MVVNDSMYLHFIYLLLLEMIHNSNEMWFNGNTDISLYLLIVQYIYFILWNYYNYKSCIMTGINRQQNVVWAHFI